MQIRPHAVILGVFGVGPLLLAAGCGGAATGARTTLANIQGSNYVTIEPVTTTTTIPVPTTLVPGVSPTSQTYTIQSGDTIFKIATSFGIEPNALIEYNSWTEGLDHLLLPGDAVQIPPGATTAGATVGGDTGAEQGDSAPFNTADTDCSHTIVAGDNPSKVAAKYDITIDELQAANAGNPVYKSFLIGSQLRIPAAGC